MSTKVFIQEPTQFYDDLQQTSTRQITHINDIHGPTIFKITLTLPPYVFAHYWTKYKLSFEDIKMQAEHLPPKFYWLSALFYGIDCIQSCVRPSFASMNEVLISCKPLAIEKIIKHCKLNLPQKTNLANNTHHKPEPPLGEITNDDMKYLSKFIFHDIKAFDIFKVPSLFTYKNKKYIAITLENDGILLKRCVTYDDYVLSCKQKESTYSTKPLLLHVESENKIFAIVEECVILSCSFNG